MGNELSGNVRRLIPIAFAVGGYSVATAFLVVGFSNGQWPFPGGDVVDFYARAGDALRAGTQVYIPGFLYGPPWAVAFAAVSWAGPAAIHAIVLVLDAVALWTIAGRDFRRLGYLLWFPLIPFELAAGQLNLLIAAAIVAAQRGTAWPLAAMSLAKVWPVLALPRRLWRPFLIALVAIAAISLPWLPLWPQWISALVETSGHPLGPVVPVPFLVRAVFVVGLLAVRRPWATALGTAISSPGLYWGQLVVLVAPVGLWLGRNDAPRRPAAETDSGLSPARPATVVSGPA
ncbi:MAG TPA: hypothetical protein VGC90_10960 [Candidatus Limnocylindrales bacterium]